MTVILIDWLCKKNNRQNQQTKNLSRGGETRPDQQEKDRTDESESSGRRREMEPNQQKEDEVEQNSIQELRARPR